MSIDEKQLIEESQNGNKQAFGKLVNHYKEKAYSIALGYVGSIDDAYDLSQEAFINAFRHIDSFDISKSFFNWFYQILKRLCFNFIRSRKIYFNKESIELDSLLSENLTPVELNERDETQKVVWTSIGKLSLEAREIIILKEFEEMSYGEIALLLEIPEGTVMSRLYYARKALKTILEEIWHVDTPG